MARMTYDLFPRERSDQHRRRRAKLLQERTNEEVAAFTYQAETAPMTRPPTDEEKAAHSAAVARFIQWLTGKIREISER